MEETSSAKVNGIQNPSFTDEVTLGKFMRIDNA